MRCVLGRGVDLGLHKIPKTLETMTSSGGPSSFSPDAPVSPLEKDLDRFSRYLLLFYLFFSVSLGVVLSYLGFLAVFSGYFPLSGFNPMNASALAGLYVALLACRPEKGLIQWSVGLSVLAEIFYQALVIPESSGLYDRLLTVGGGTGLVGLGFMIHLFLSASTPQARSRARAFLLAGLCVLLYPIAAGKGMGLLSQLSPNVWDSHLYALEGAWGVFPAQIVARFLAEHFALHYLALAVYSRLPLFVFIGIYLGARYPERCYPNVLVAFVGAGLMAFPFFLLLPMVGIDVFVGTPPWPLGEMPALTRWGPVQAPAGYPRTCLPSLHTTWVLIFYFAVSRLSVAWKGFALVVVLLTLLSALGPSVGHYSLDLLLAVPYCLGIMAMATPATENNRAVRRASLAFGFGSLLFWVLAFRFFGHGLAALPALSWGTILGGCVVAFGLESLLGRRTLGA